jgi:hypothetical protein
MRRNAAVLIPCKNNRNCEENFHSATESFNLALALPSFAVTMSLSCEELSPSSYLPQSTEQCCHTPAWVLWENACQGGAEAARNTWGTPGHTSHRIRRKRVHKANSFIAGIILRQIHKRNITWVINLFRITRFLGFVSIVRNSKY